MTQLIPIDKIDYDKTKPIVQEQVEYLAGSIKDVGFLHPITVTPRLDRFYLVAGLHRLLAHIKLEKTEIESLVTENDLTPDEVINVHLQENLRRKNLPWYELVEMEKSLHDLRQRQHGKATVGRGKKGWSLRDTARELDLALGAASQDLQLASALEADPTLRKIQDRTTALKLIKEEGKRIEQRASNMLVFTKEVSEIYHGDASYTLQRLPKESFDACITDPPWLVYRDKDLVADERTLGVFEDVYRVLKKNSFLYAFVGTKDFIFYQQNLPKIGYKVQDFPLIWVKENVFSHGVKSWEYGRNFEQILLAVKGAPALTEHRQKSAVFTFPAVHHTRMIHPNEKPIEIIERIIKDCCFDSAAIVDPFAGSGVVLEAAKKLGHRYVGTERDRKFYEGIVKRLESKSEVAS